MAQPKPTRLQVESRMSLPGMASVFVSKRPALRRREQRAAELHAALVAETDREFARLTAPFEIRSAPRPLLVSAPSCYVALRSLAPIIAEPPPVVLAPATVREWEAEDAYDRARDARTAVCELLHALAGAAADQAEARAERLRRRAAREARAHLRTLGADAHLGKALLDARLYDESARHYLRALKRRPAAGGTGSGGLDAGFEAAIAHIRLGERFGALHSLPSPRPLGVRPLRGAAPGAADTGGAREPGSAARAVAAKAPGDASERVPPAAHARGAEATHAIDRCDVALLAEVTPRRTVSALAAERAEVRRAVSQTHAALLRTVYELLCRRSRERLVREAENAAAPSSDEFPRAALAARRPGAERRTRAHGEGEARAHGGAAARGRVRAAWVSVTKEGEEALRQPSPAKLRATSEAKAVRPATAPPAPHDWQRVSPCARPLEVAGAVRASAVRERVRAALARAYAPERLLDVSRGVFCDFAREAGLAMRARRGADVPLDARDGADEGAGGVQTEREAAMAAADAALEAAAQMLQPSSDAQPTPSEPRSPMCARAAAPSAPANDTGSWAPKTVTFGHFVLALGVFSFRRFPHVPPMLLSERLDETLRECVEPWARAQPAALCAADFASPSPLGRALRAHAPVLARLFRAYAEATGARLRADEGARRAPAPTPVPAPAQPEPLHLELPEWLGFWADLGLLAVPGERGREGEAGSTQDGHADERAGAAGANGAAHGYSGARLHACLVAAMLDARDGDDVVAAVVTHEKQQRAQPHAPGLRAASFAPAIARVLESDARGEDGSVQPRAPPPGSHAAASLSARVDALLRGQLVRAWSSSAMIELGVAHAPSSAAFLETRQLVLRLAAAPERVAGLARD
ncbi:hypothetical protein KFE25_003458 [Diacronema lutheri]|uniref:Uncharacterized protein n=1 Tax=Diacronema lutheri TaxID=2081491 RepID=A0A8J5XS32_DIALT|nr:hypothetical protein KFE25_003458 [Diacronema lutheri]